jgi:type VI secretion system secreted protein Hcp
MLSDYEIFLQVEGVPGESSDAEHEDWIDIVSYSHSISLPAGSMSVEGSRLSGGADHEDFTVVKPLDKASPKLALYCCKAQHIPSVQIELCRASGDNQKFMEYVLEDVIVSAVSVSGSASRGEDVPVEEVSFSYGKITWTYTEFDPVTGKAKGDVSSQWNVELNKEG